MLRPDPPPYQRPMGYVNQYMREFRDSNEFPNQEWQDADNGIYMGRTEGCQDPRNQAVAYTSGWQIPEQSYFKATITVRNLTLAIVI